MGLVYWVLGSLDSPIRLGKPPFTNSADFFNIVQTAFDSLPPPLVLNMNVADQEVRHSTGFATTTSTYKKPNADKLSLAIN